MRYLLPWRAPCQARCTGCVSSCAPAACCPFPDPSPAPPWMWHCNWFPDWSPPLAAYTVMVPWWVSLVSHPCMPWTQSWGQKENKNKKKASWLLFSSDSLSENKNILTLEEGTERVELIDKTNSVSAITGFMLQVLLKIHAWYSFWRVFCTPRAFECALTDSWMTWQVRFFPTGSHWQKVDWNHTIYHSTAENAHNYKACSYTIGRFVCNNDACTIPWAHMITVCVQHSFLNSQDIILWQWIKPRSWCSLCHTCLSFVSYIHSNLLFLSSEMKTLILF